jgi:hypothetical protein
MQDLYYVGKEYHNDFRSGYDGQVIYDQNSTYSTADTSAIIAAGGDSWSLQQGGLDPSYGIIEIHIPATLTDQEQLDAGNSQARDHDYLQLEAGLYFDVIQKDSALVQNLQDVIDGNATVTEFATAIQTATDATADRQEFGSITDASNDLVSIFSGAGVEINEKPHMIHFDNVNYYGYDDFSTPTQLSTGGVMNGLSETTLIGEFRIDENADGAWSFDADMSVYLNNNSRPTYQQVMVQDVWGVSSNLNYQFENYTSGNLNASSVNTTISRDANGDLTISETVPIFNTLTENSTVTFATNMNYGSTHNAGTYSIRYDDYSTPSITLI